MPISNRLAAISLWLGGLSGVFVTGLFLAAANQADESVFGLTHFDYDRWVIFPLLLTMVGVAALHRFQSVEYGRLGRVGFKTTMTGYVLLVSGEVWVHLLFVPFGHPLRFVGGNLLLLGLVGVIAGWAIWGMASLGSKSLPSWAAPVPLVIALVWVSARFPLHDVLDASGPMLVRVVNAIGFGLLGAVLWQADHSLIRQSRKSAALTSNGA
jgi:hypothetical protein